MDLNRQILQVKNQLEKQFKEISQYRRKQALKKSGGANGASHNFRPDPKKQSNTGFNLSDEMFLDLKELGLTDFDDVYRMILEFAEQNLEIKDDLTKLRLTEIDVSENNMANLFTADFLQANNLNELKKLTSVKTLNILNNLDLESIQDTIVQIQMVMPCVQNLSISLSEEEDVSFILNHMKQLEVLNNIKVERQQLFNSRKRAEEGQGQQNNNTQQTENSMDQIEAQFHKQHYESLKESSKTQQQAESNLCDVLEHEVSQRTNEIHRFSGEQTVDARMAKHVMDSDMFAEAMKSAHDSSPKFHVARPSNQMQREGTGRLTRNGNMLIVSGSDKKSTYDMASRPSQGPIDYTDANTSPTKGQLKKDQSRKGMRASPLKKARNKENDLVQQLDSERSPQKSRREAQILSQKSALPQSQQVQEQEVAQFRQRQVVFNQQEMITSIESQKQQIETKNTIDSQNLKRKTIDSSPMTPMVKAQYSEPKNDNNANEVGNFLIQQPIPSSIYHEEKVASKEVPRDNNCKIWPNILINDDSIQKTQSIMNTEFASSSVIKNTTQNKSMSDIISQRSSNRLTSLEQQKINQLRENIINYNQDQNDFENDPNFENSTYKVDERQGKKQPASSDEDKSSNIEEQNSAPGTEKNEEDGDEDALNKKQQHQLMSPNRRLQILEEGRHHALSMDHQSTRNGVDDKMHNQLSEIVEDDRETDLDRDHNSKGTGNFGIQCTVESSKFNARSHQNSLSNQNWKSIGAGLRDPEIFCNTFNPHMGNLLEKDIKVQDQRSELNEIQMMTQQINLEGLHVRKEQQKKDSDQLDPKGHHFINVDFEKKMNIQEDSSAQNSFQTTLELKNDKSFSKLKQRINLDIENVTDGTQGDLSGRKIDVDAEFPFVEEFAGQDEEKAQLKPSDLEDVGNVFDRIRVLHKKKSEQNNQNGKKFIQKSNSKVDELALEFDKKLSEVMLNLANHLKDNLITTSQKRSEIERSKYELWNYCQDTTLKILKLKSASFNQKESREIVQILSKISEGINESFEGLGKLFYSRPEFELKNLTSKKIEQMKNYCIKFDQLKDQNAQQAQEIAKNKKQITKLLENCLDLNEQKDQQENDIKKLQESLSYYQNELDQAQQKIYHLQNFEVAYNKAQNEIRSIKGQLETQELLFSQKDDELCKMTLKKNDYEKDFLRLKRQIVGLQEEVQDMQDEVDSLNEENQQYLDMIIRYSLGKRSNSNGTMKVNQQWLKRQIKRKRGNCNEAVSDLRSQYSLSNFSRSPLECQKKDKKLEGKMRTNSSQVSNQKVRKLKNVMPANGRASRFSNVSQSLNCHESDLNNTQKIISELGDMKQSSSIQFDMNIQQFAKSKRSTKNFNHRNGFFRIDKYSFLHSQKKYKSKSPHYTNRKDLGAADENIMIPELSNIQITQQTHEHQHTQTDENPLIFEEKLNNTNKIQDDSIEYCRPEILIKSQMSHGSYDDVKKNEETPHKIVQSAVKSLNKVESQYIEKSCTKDNLVNQVDVAASQMQSSNKKYDIKAIRTNDGHKISMRDCDPSPTKSGKDNKNDLMSEHFSNNLMDSRLSRGEIIPNIHDNSKSRVNKFQKFNNISYELSDKQKLNTLNEMHEHNNYHNNQNYYNKFANSGVPRLHFEEYGFSYNEPGYLGYQATSKCSAKRRTHGRNNTVSPNSSKMLLTTKVLELEQANYQMGHGQLTHPSSTKRSKSSCSQRNTTGYHQQSKDYSDQMQSLIRRKLQQIQPIEIKYNHFVDDGQEDSYFGNTVARGQGEPGYLGQNQLTFNQQSPLMVNDASFLGPKSISPQIRKKNVNMTMTSGAGTGSNNQSQIGLGRGQGKGHGKMCYTLKQLKEIIVDIFAKKEKHDWRCINEYKQNRETMEQFLNTYLNQKYGLRTLVIDQINAIVAAIQRFQGQDHDVLLFGKVLRHEINEEFRKNALTMRKNVENLMKNLISEKNPQKGLDFINRAFLKYQSGKQAVEFNIWNKIIFTLFEQTDAMVIEDRARATKVAAQMEKQMNSTHKQSNYQFETDKRAAKSKRIRNKSSIGNKGRRSNNAAMWSGDPCKSGTATSTGARDLRKRNKSVQLSSVTNPKLQFSELMSILNQFILDEHEKFLSKFLALFRQIDLDRDGIISNQEFVDLYTRMNLKISNLTSDKAAQDQNFKQTLDQETSNFLDMLDPYQSDRITFSDVVKLFSSQVVDEKKRNNYLAEQRNFDLDPIPENDASQEVNPLDKTQKICLNSNPDLMGDLQMDRKSSPSNNLAEAINSLTAEENGDKAPSTQGSMMPDAIANKYRRLDSHNLTQIDELTDSQKNVYSADYSRSLTPCMPGPTASSHAYSTKNKRAESLKISNKASNCVAGDDRNRKQYQQAADAKIGQINEEVDVFGEPHRASDDVSTPIEENDNSKHINLDDIELLNEYEKKINNDIVELERKMQDFIRK